MSHRKAQTIAPIQSTAGAIPVRNDKGEVSMQKVKVSRYITGKRPGYAPRSSSEEESEEEEFVSHKIKQDEDEEDRHRHDIPSIAFSESEKMDPRLRRLYISQNEQKESKADDSSDESDEEERPGRRYESDSASEEEVVDEDEIAKRRALIRQRALDRQDEQDILTREEDKAAQSDESESEYEEYTDSDEEEKPERLKPVFVKHRDRITMKEKELMDEKERMLEEEAQLKSHARRAETLKMLESEIRREKELRSSQTSSSQSSTNESKIEDVVTDEENDELEFEAWKLRELKRIKRDREEREAIERERLEIERMHNLTEEERRTEMKSNPKVIMNRASKGKYKFLQKYYHRGVFYLDKEEDVFSRDYSAPTLEDHFDKTILPKVMQVKNFGRSGRTKYTHLVDQDTTNFESPWVSETSVNVKFHATQAAGVRQVFERPSAKKRKMEDE